MCCTQKRLIVNKNDLRQINIGYSFTLRADLNEDQEGNSEGLFNMKPKEINKKPT